MIPALIGAEALKKVNWKKVIIALLIIALVLYIYFKGKAAGKQGKAKYVDIPADIIGGNASGSDANIGQVETGAKIRQIAIGLHDDMDGYNWLGHDMKYYKEWVTLSNAGFVAVYNDFNKMYMSEGKGTLKQWLVDEMYRDSLVDDIILPRMASLNLV